MSIFSSIFDGLKSIPSPGELINNAVRGISDVANSVKVGATGIWNNITSIDPIKTAEKVLNFGNTVTAAMGKNINNVFGTNGIVGVLGSIVDNVPNKIFNNTVNTVANAGGKLAEDIGKPAATAFGISAAGLGIAAALGAIFILKRF